MKEAVRGNILSYLDGYIGKGALIDKKHCYLCGSAEFNRRAGSVRDNPELEVFECVSCGLVFLSSFDHIKDDFYKDSRRYGKEPLDPQTWLNDTLWDDQRRFQHSKLILLNRKLLDFGCGAADYRSFERRRCIIDSLLD